MPAGAEIVLRIHAKATQPGTHVFRAEVVCDDLETKLAAEETTRFFVEEDRWADASAAYSRAGARRRRGNGAICDVFNAWLRDKPQA